MTVKVQPPDYIKREGAKTTTKKNKKNTLIPVHKHNGRYKLVAGREAIKGSIRKQTNKK